MSLETDSCGFVGVTFFVSRKRNGNCETVGAAHSCNTENCGIELVGGEVKAFANPLTIEFCRLLEKHMAAHRGKVAHISSGGIWVLGASDVSESVRTELLTAWNKAARAVVTERVLAN